MNAGGVLTCTSIASMSLGLRFKTSISPASSSIRPKESYDVHNITLAEEQVNEPVKAHYHQSNACTRLKEHLHGVAAGVASS